MKQLRLFLLVAMMIVPVSAFAQSSVDGPWAGSIQCQLDVEQSGYSRHEIQSWTLTGGAPSNQSDIRVYPAIWTVQGQGGLQRPAGLRAGNAQWTVNIPPTSA